MENNLIYFLIVYCLIREMFYTYTTHKLLNKIMSRNYHDYEFSKNVDKTLETGNTTATSLKEDQGLAEDLSPIHGFAGVN